MRKTILHTQFTFSERPSIVERLDSQSYYFNYDIVPTTFKDEEGVIDGYTCKSLYIVGPLTSDRILQGYLDVHYPIDKELKLINNYNALLAGITDDQQYRVDYEVYLRDRQLFREYLIANVDKIHNYD